MFIKAKAPGAAVLADIEVTLVGQTAPGRPAAAQPAPVQPINFNSQSLHVTSSQLKSRKWEEARYLVNINNSLGYAWLHIQIEAGEVGSADLDVSVFVVVCRAEQTNRLFPFEVFFCGTGKKKALLSVIGKHLRHFQDFAYEILYGVEQRYPSRVLFIEVRSSKQKQQLHYCDSSYLYKSFVPFY